MNRLIIIGASGHGKVVADIAKLVGYRDIVFLDGDGSIKECAGYPVVGKETMAKKLLGDIFIAVGNDRIRKRLMEENANRKIPILIHPAAVVAAGTQIGEGTAVMAGAVINPNSKIGTGCIINTCASIDHDCIVGDFCHLAVGAHMCGTVKVGNNVWIGAGATVSNNVSICNETVIGAGALVIKDIDKTGTYIGIPAKEVDTKTKGYSAN
ncbi:acetyltransferase [Selenomonas ruminantium]|uniref:Transferase hexapeptide (Six repeat-containing protein) n=1 Tax=Selenomonas ruminantium TaxID=971 RepID=A0A1H3WSE1_SELRU|nr:acetyltransferase [Selenomonas ruminantium]SDZ89108.1 transferase hexapeptide (six repeat-containing protein) [Selenomonas ruminantium]